MGLAGVRNRDNVALFDDKKPLAVVYFAIDYVRNTKGEHTRTMASFPGTRACTVQRWAVEPGNKATHNTAGFLCNTLIYLQVATTGATGMARMIVPFSDIVKPED